MTHALERPGVQLRAGACHFRRAPRPPAGSVTFTSLGGAMVLALGWVSAADVDVMAMPAVQSAAGVPGEFFAHVVETSPLERIELEDGEPAGQPAEPGAEDAAETPLLTDSGQELPFLPGPMRPLAVTVLSDAEPSPSFMVVLRLGSAMVSAVAGGSVPGESRCRLKAPEAEDLLLEVHGASFAVESAGELPTPLARVPRSLWQENGHGLAATVDLRGLVEQVSVRVREVDGSSVAARLWFRAPQDAKWAPVGETSRASVIVFRGSQLEAIAVPSLGHFARAWLRPGENTMVIPDPATVTVSVQGVPREMTAWRVRVNLCILVRREPGLDALSRSEDEPWPANGEDAMGLVRNHKCDAMTITNGTGILELPCCGSYVAMPVVQAGEASVPLLDAAVPVEVTAPGAHLEAMIRIDPERVRAALR